MLTIQSPKSEKNIISYNGPKGSLFFGCIPQVQELGVLEFLKNNSENYGDIIPFKMGIDKVLQINHPKYIEEILLKRHKKFKKASNHQRFREVLGDGLLTSNGGKWKHDRQRIQPAFKKDLLEDQYIKVVKRVAKKCRLRWFESAQSNDTINVTSEMARITLSIMFETMFGYNANDEELEKVDKAIKKFMDYVGLPRLFPNFDLNKVLLKSEYRELCKTRNEIKNFVRNIYEKELKKPSPYINMMRLMIDAMKDENQSFNFEDIYDQTITMFFAGYETTATLLQWAWLCLDKNPDIQKKLLEELNGINSIDELSVSELDKLEYLDAFIKETMRMYPSFWATTRSSIETEEIYDIRITPSQTLLLPQYIMHRHPKFWDAPNSFSPERFIGEKAKTIHPGSYFPFSLGHRKCIGYRLAEMEAKLILALLLPKFILETPSSQELELKPIISLRLKKDLLMHITQRK